VPVYPLTRARDNHLNARRSSMYIFGYSQRALDSFSMRARFTKVRGNIVNIND